VARLVLTSFAACALAVVAAVGAACGARTGLPGLGEGAPTLADGGRDGTSLEDGSSPFDASSEQSFIEESTDALDEALPFTGVADPVLPLCEAPDAGDAGRCKGLACRVPKCSSGADTIVEGYAYAPDGKLPLYNVEVYVPNARLETIPRGVQCEPCGQAVTGEPITTAFTDPKGHFTLRGVPAGNDVPLVVQLGKWRRQATIHHIDACVANTLTDPNLSRLPKNQKEGNMPHVALTTGGCDQMGCMLTKLGIDDAEFGVESDGPDKAIHVYVGSGGMGPSMAALAMDLWGTEKTLFSYDEAIFSCECSEALESKGNIALGGAPFDVVTKYLDAGGRIFTTDFQYTWYKYSPDPAIGETVAESDYTGLGEIHGQAPEAAIPMTLTGTFPKAVALADWLANVFSGAKLPSGATYPYDPYSQRGQIETDVVFGNVQHLDPTRTHTWASSRYKHSPDTPPPPEDAGGVEPRIFTVDTPVGAAPGKQCGRGVHIDAHVDQTGQSVGTGYPRTGCSSDLKPDEAAFAFLFFDLSSCSDTCD
jgi:hypothetical protein